jgi:sugar lactone lactonase YvrE
MNIFALPLALIIPLGLNAKLQLEEIISPSCGLNNPFGVTFDSIGNTYIAEYEGGRILKLDNNGKLHTVSGNGKKGFSGDGMPASQGVFNGMHNLAWSSNEVLYISDTHNHLVRKIDLKTNRLSTVAGTPNQKGFSGDGGPANEAKLDTPISISLTPDEKTMLIADISNKRIRVVDLETGIIRTVAGNGKTGKPISNQSARGQPLIGPRAAIMDDSNNLFILERNGNALRVVRPNGKIYTLAGTGKRGSQDGPALKSTFNGPKHLCLDNDGNIVIADDKNQLIRLYNPKTKSVSTILGSKALPKTVLNRPHGVALAPDGGIWVCDSWNNRILILRNQ